MLEGVGRRRLIDVARGDDEPDLVIEGARVFSAFTREWLDVDVAIADGRIAGLGSYPGRHRLDAGGRYLVPGFVDAHVHIESSKLMVDEFARVVLARGTTAVVADPHEIANVLGTDGIHWLLDVCDDVPLDVWVMAPSCVPASAFESPRRPLSVGDLESVLRRRHALGVAEMMNFPAVIAGDPTELRKLDLRGATHVDGHAPGVRGNALNAYLAAGIRSDHEATTYEEALEKRRKGAWVLIREASNARNLHALLPLVREFGPERCAFCTDDREPDFLVREGHLDQMCREAVAEGIAPEDALLLASLHPAQYHGLADAGAIAPGYRADLVLLDDLVTFRASRVYKDGALVFDGHVVTPFPRPEVPVWVRQTVHAAPVGLSDLRVPSTGQPVRVIEIVPEQLLTNARIELPTVAARRRGRRSHARRRQDRRGRAPPRHRTGRCRVRARVRAAARCVRDDGRPRRAQHRVRWRRRPRHGARDLPPRTDRRRDRGARRRRRPRRAAAARRGPALGSAGRRGRRAPRDAGAPALRAGRRDRLAVHVAELPGALGDPVAQDHRPRARRRRPLRDRAADRRACELRRAERARPRDVRTRARRGLRALPLGRGGGVRCRTVRLVPVARGCLSRGARGRTRGAQARARTGASRPRGPRGARGRADPGLGQRAGVGPARPSQRWTSSRASRGSTTPTASGSDSRS